MIAKKKNICPKASVIMMKYTPEVRSDRSPITKAATPENSIATNQITGMSLVPEIVNGHSINGEYVCA